MKANIFIILILITACYLAGSATQCTFNITKWDNEMVNFTIFMIIFIVVCVLIN